MKIKLTPGKLDLDFDEIIPGLCVGSAPNPGWGVAANGFDVLFLVAEEYQLGVKSFPGVEVHYCPLPDFRLTPDSVKKSFICARKITDLIRQGKKVLLTCLAGHDRSASIAALVLYYMYYEAGWSGKDCVKYIQSRRRGTLGSIQGQWLRTLPSKDKQKKR